MDGSETTTSESFGTVLHEVMQAHSPARIDGTRWTAASLATRLGVDASLVRRWLRGERVPPARAGRTRDEASRIGRIAEILELSPEERQRLAAAQLGTLSALARGVPLPREERAAGVARVLDNTATANALPRGVVPEHLRKPLPRDTMAITNQAEVIGMCIRLFTAAARHPQVGATIYQTYNGAGSLAEQEGQRREWQQALRDTLAQGWNVCHLIRLERGSSQRAVQFVDNMLSLLGTKGTYMPYYLTQPGPLAAPYGICLVPGIGAVVSFATKQSVYVDAALYVNDPEQLKVLEAHMQLLCSAQLAAPLFVNYPRSDKDEELTFLEALKRLEDAPGGRFLVKDGLSAITHPLSFYARGPLSRLMHDRRETFEHHVQSYPYRDVCPKRAIVRLVQHGDPAQDDEGLFTASASGQRRSLSERHEWLKNVIHLLHQHENYELALLDEAEEPTILRTDQEAPNEQTKGRKAAADQGISTQQGMLTEWETFRNQAVLLQWRRGDPPHISITEPSIVRAFESYGEALWNKIKPVNHEKEYVVWWLEQQIAGLKED